MITATSSPTPAAVSGSAMMSASIATAVWVGTDDNKPLYNAYGGTMYGAGLPADIWKSVMDGALAGTDWEQFPTPGMIGGQAGASTWESSGSSSGGGQTATPQVQPEPSAPVAPVEPQQPAPQQPPLTIQVPGLPEIVIPGAGGGAAPAPAPEPAPAPGGGAGGGGDTGGGGTGGGGTGGGAGGGGGAAGGGAGGA